MAAGLTAIALLIGQGPGVARHGASRSSRVSATRRSPVPGAPNCHASCRGAALTRAYSADAATYSVAAVVAPPVAAALVALAPDRAAVAARRPAARLAGACCARSRSTAAHARPVRRPRCGRTCAPGSRTITGHPRPAPDRDHHHRRIRRPGLALHRRSDPRPVESPGRSGSPASSSGCSRPAASARPCGSRGIRSPVPIGPSSSAPACRPSCSPRSAWRRPPPAARRGVRHGRHRAAPVSAMFQVRAREAPTRVQSQVFTTSASLRMTAFAHGHRCLRLAARSRHRGGDRLRCRPPRDLARAGTRRSARDCRDASTGCAGADGAPTGVFYPRRMSTPGRLALVGSGEYLPVMQDIESWLLEDRPRRYVQLATAAAPEGDASLRHWHALGAESAARARRRAGRRRRAHARRRGRPAHAHAIAGAGLIYLSGGNPGHLARTLRGTPRLGGHRAGVARRRIACRLQRGRDGDGRLCARLPPSAAAAAPTDWASCPTCACCRTSTSSAG